MAQASGSCNAEITKLLEKLTEKITRHAHGLHVLREAVTVEEQQHQTEEIYLRDRKKEIADNDANQTRAHKDEAVNGTEYTSKLENTKKEMSAYREAAVNAEMNSKLLAAVRELVTQKKIELAELRRNTQLASQAENGSSAVNAAIIKQFSADLEQVTNRVKQAKKDLIELAAKKAEASKIINEMRAYIITEETAKLEVECRVKAMSVELNKQKEMASSSRQKLIRFRQVAPSPKEASRLALLKELREERIRGGKLTKDLCEMTQLAAEKAAKRKQWLENHFPQSDEVIVTGESNSNLSFV